VNDTAHNPGPDPAPITLAVDALGGQHGPREVVAAVARASQERHPTQPVYFTLVGDEARLTDELVQHGHNPERIRIHHAPEVVELEASPEQVSERDGDETSIATACRLVASGEADAVVTAGHPAAAVLAGKHHFARVPGVDRSALCAVYPTSRLGEADQRRLGLLLDVGASHEASPSDLHSFGLMGSAYGRLVRPDTDPKVALLSTTAHPGSSPTDIARAADRLDDDDRVRFIGTCEGHELLSGRADVVVCNGFIGNVALKLLEGVSQTALEVARAAYQRRFLWKVGLRLLSGGLDELKRLTDYEEYGGAPLLGLRQVMIVAHSRSHRKAIDNALRLAIKNVKADLPDHLRDLLAPQGA
jgi:glycerol-3-phosphate acyltransferase PlsX